MKRLLPILLCCISILTAAAPDRSQKQKYRELSILRGYLEVARDSLQREVAARWRAKQLYVVQRENDKEELTALRETQERLHGDLARLREELFSREKSLEEEKKNTASVAEEWQFVGASMEELFKKEADRLPEVFPTDVEPLQSRLEALRREYKRNGRAEDALAAFGEYRLDLLRTGSRVATAKSTLIPDRSDPRELTLVRFGNVFAYGFNSGTDRFIIHQSGNLGADRFTIEPVGPSALNDYLAAALPEWVEQQTVEGPLMLDIMQNAQTSLLVSGKRIKATDRMLGFVKAGGPVLIPLFLLVFWALLLVIVKLLQFGKKHTGDSKISTVVLGYLDENKIAEAQKYVKSYHGVVARVVTTCLEHSRWNRNSAEKAIKEILIDEVPQLNKHLNTLAVIAGAAPLLGLLGTVTGMISLFKVITNYGTGDPKILAGGISEALITTEVGLTVAIPVLLIHNFLRNRTNDIQTETEKHAIRILNHLWPET